MALLDSWGSNTGSEMLSSPVPINSGSSWQTSTPTTSPIPGSGNWMDILKLLASSGGRGVGVPNAPFGSISPQLTPQQGVPLYYMPQSAPVMDEQQKQSSVGEVDQYAKILATIFGFGG